MDSAFVSTLSAIPKRSFLAGQGTTAQLSGFIRTSPSHTSRGGQLLRTRYGSYADRWSQLPPAQLHQGINPCGSTAAAERATEQGSSPRAWGATNRVAKVLPLRATSPSCGKRSLLLKHLNAAEVLSGTLQPNSQVGLLSQPSPL